jgi:HK97 family phage portal protein
MLKRLTNMIFGFDTPEVKNEFYPMTETHRMGEIFSMNDPTPAGKSVTPDTAMRVAAVYACVRLLAGSVGQLPLPVYRRDRGTNVRHSLPDDDLWRLLNLEPNPRWTAAAMWEYMTASMLLTGNGYAVLRRKTSKSPEVVGIHPMNPHMVSVRREGDQLLYTFATGEDKFSLYQDDVLHFAGFGFDGERGLSVIEYGARNATGVALAADDHSGAFYQQGTSSRYVIKAPGRIHPQQAETLREQFAQRYFGTDNNRPLVLAEGLDVSTISMSARDAQLLEARQFQVEDIARAFGVPPFMIGATEKTSSWGSGVEHMGRGYLIYTLAPHLARFQQEISRKLFTKNVKFVEWDTDGFLKADMSARFTAYRQAIGGSQGPGWMTGDEIRAMENMPPLGGESARAFAPNVGQQAEGASNDE